VRKFSFGQVGELLPKGFMQVSVPEVGGCVVGIKLYGSLEFPVCILPTVLIEENRAKRIMGLCESIVESQCLPRGDGGLLKVLGQWHEAARPYQPGLGRRLQPGQDLGRS